MHINANERMHSFSKTLKMTPCPNLEKMCSIFLHFIHGHLILMHGFEHGKVHFKKNCVQFWVYVNTLFFQVSHYYV
jgi:hypothetical protein